MSAALQESNDYFGALKARGRDIEQRYRALTPRSRELFERAGNVFPGSYTRDAVMRGPYAPFVVSAQGTRMTDADGRELVDMWFNATSLPLGHAHPLVRAAAEEQLAKGTVYFAPTEHELALAEVLLARLPGAERIRFANSGSEAVMMALRFARAYRGRSLIVKFEGSYHGAYDDVSWSVGPSVAAAGDPKSPTPAAETLGLAGTDGRVAVLPFNDTDALARYVEAHHAEIATILVEPMANRMGLILPDREFLAEARSLCDRYGIVLIFDEVIAFRLGHSGAQGALGITPDLTTLGKIIGGGFAVGALAGRAEILDLSRPGGTRVTHAGTFNGNPMTALAGRATMQALTPAVFDEMNALGAHVRDRLGTICEGLPLQVTGAGSLFKVTATDRPIRNYRDAATADKDWEQTASLALLNEGFMLTPNLSGCVSAVTPLEEAEDFLSAFARIVAS